MAGLNAQAALLWVATLLLLPLATALPHLRIMTLGDSITKGSGSTHLNGYRGYLRDKLVAYASGESSWSIDMIGSLKHGNMADNDHEGHSGEFIREISTYVGRSIAARPNVVLIHAGTNNMDKEIDLDIAPDLYNSMLINIMNKAPEAVILVAPVIWANDERMNRNTDKFNADLRTIIRSKQNDGKRILEVPIEIGLSDLNDSKHPNNQGYNKMATAWYNAILEADERGWLRGPVRKAPSDAPCTGLGITTGNGQNCGVGTGSDVGCQGGNWRRELGVFTDNKVWEEVGSIMSPVSGGKRSGLILADLNNDGIADYIMADSDGTVRAWINGGSPNQWTSLGKINPPWTSVTGEMVRMADVDGDGKADMIVLYSDGAAKVWKNTDNGKKFESLDSQWATGLESRSKIHFHDMDGDGYADYCIVYSGGAVRWARNTHNNGKDPSKKNWETAVEIATGVAGVPNDRARLGDLDGDGKADYIIVYQGGAVRALRNTGSLNGEGRNWDDLGEIAPGVSGVTGDMIRFADMNGDGEADFLAVDEDGGIRMWRNRGGAGSNTGTVKWQVADLTGDGKGDMIAVDAKGRARAWLNKGIGQWDSIGEIAPGLDEDLSASRIEFTDVNGDGKADFLVIYGGGAVKAYLNNGNIPKTGDGRIWSQPLEIATGVGEPGRKVRFADLNGDGWADYLIVFDGGAVDAYLSNQNIPPTNGGRIWGQKMTIATGVGEPGSKVRFADINGDGRAEYIVQYDGGAAIAYNNTGNIPDAGKPRNWDRMGMIAAGVTDQGPVQWADLTGDGKADYLVIFENGRMNAYINTCDWKPVPGTGTDPGGNPGDGGIDDGGGDNGGGGMGDSGTTTRDGGGGGNPTDGPGGGGDDDDDDDDDTTVVNPPPPKPTGSGRCTGPGCYRGKCEGSVCADLGCEGDDCVGNWCVGDDCIATGCIGPGCKNGKCSGSGCKTSGCIGDDCDDEDGCTGPSCIGIGCLGPDCAPSGKCIGPSCSIVTCWGLGCVKGTCIGPGCHKSGGASGGGGDAVSIYP